jgi:hypothetical protein
MPDCVRLKNGDAGTKASGLKCRSSAGKTAAYHGKINMPVSAKRGRGNDLGASICPKAGLQGIYHRSANKTHL